MPLNVNQFLDRTSAANRNALNSGRSNIFPGPQKGLQGIPVSSQFALDRRKGRFGIEHGYIWPHGPVLRHRSGQRSCSVRTAAEREGQAQHHQGDTQGQERQAHHHWAMQHQVYPKEGMTI